MLISSDDLKRKIIQYMLDHGYIFPDTMNAFRRILKRNPDSLKECSDEDLLKVSNWIDAHCTENTAYQAATRTLWSQNNVDINDSLTDRNKDAIYYFFSAANIAINEQPERDRIAAEKAEQERAKQDRLNANDNRYAGEVGDAVEFEVADVSVAGYIEIPVWPHDSYPLLKIIDVNGLIYNWGNKA